MLKEIARKIRKGETDGANPFYELITDRELTLKEFKNIASQISEGTTSGDEPCEWELQYDEDTEENQYNSDSYEE